MNNPKQSVTYSVPYRKNFILENSLFAKLSKKLTLMRTISTLEKFSPPAGKPLADTKDLVIHLLYHELVRAEMILHLSGVGNNNPTSMLFIRSAISSTEKYLTK